MSRPSLLVVVSAALAAAAACRQGEQACVEPSPADAGTADPSLLVVEATAEHVSGVYEDGAGLAIAFTATHRAGEVSLELDHPGHRLLAVRGDATHAQVELRAGTHAWTLVTDGLGGDLADLELGGTWRATDLEALEGLRDAPELALLPAVSRALGARGLRGDTAPATLPIHLLAREIARDTGAEPPPMETSTCCDDYPDRDDYCRGMCGQDCNCWSWVCGDCCYHHGCAAHDDWCRRREWHFCIGLLPVVVLAGC